MLSRNVERRIADRRPPIRKSLHGNTFAIVDTQHGLHLSITAGWIDDLTTVQSVFAT